MEDWPVGRNVRLLRTVFRPEKIQTFCKSLLNFPRKLVSLLKWPPLVPSCEMFEDALNSNRRSVTVESNCPRELSNKISRSAHCRQPRIWATSVNLGWRKELKNTSRLHVVAAREHVAHYVAMVTVQKASLNHILFRKEWPMRLAYKRAQKSRDRAGPCTKARTGTSMHAAHIHTHTDWWVNRWLTKPVIKFDFHLTPNFMWMSQFNPGKHEDDAHRTCRLSPWFFPSKRTEEMSNTATATSSLIVKMY